MSARVSRGGPPKGVGRNPQRRKMVLDVDLNAPPAEVPSEVGTSSQAPVNVEVLADQGPPPQPVTIVDVDALDDDVIVSSPRAFAEAKNNSRRNRGSNVVAVDLARHAANSRNKRQRVPTNQPVINCESYVTPGGNAHSVSGSGATISQRTRSMMPPRPPPPPPPPEPTFNCPVCMGPLVEEMSTKCGHIFCKACIKKSISAQGKCPTCRRKVTMKDTIRIYLPATNLT